MGILIEIEDITKTLEEAIVAIDAIEPMQTSTYNWFSIESSNRKLFAAKQQLANCIKTLEEASGDRMDAYVISRALTGLTNDVCDKLLEQIPSKERGAFSAIITEWWSKRYYNPVLLTPAQEAAFVSYLRNYAAAKEQNEKDELEDLMRLHS
jgi:hypothetical protein